MGAENQQRIFIWKEPQVWLPVVLKLLTPMTDGGLLDRLKRSPPLLRSRNWLDDVIESEIGYRPDSKRIIAEGLRNHFEFVRAYHGSRPITTVTFLQEGIRVGDPEELKRLAREIFATFPDLDRAILEVSQGQLGTYEDWDRGRVHFSLTKEELLQKCGA